MKKLIIISLIIIFLLSICNAFVSYPPCVNQPIENVDTIELLYYDDNSYSIFYDSEEPFAASYTLEEDEIHDFWQQLMKLKFGIIKNDPPDNLGNYIVRITYNDGYVDLIGTRINHYLNPEGVVQPSGIFFTKNKTAFIELFSQYFDESFMLQSN